MRAPVLVLVALVVGCASPATMLAQLKQAATQARLPKVLACWEKEFEAAAFSGEYVAVVNFTVRADRGQIEEASLDGLYSTAGGAETPAGSDRMKRCLVDALNGSSLAAGGMKPSSDVRVERMRIAFHGDSSVRAKAREKTPNILIGPRADRCQGLYAHDPPREATKLFSELDDAQSDADRSGADKPDQYARALQHAYDVALELVERLRTDAAQDDVPNKSRKRILDALRKARTTARDIGSTIGCMPPA